LRDLGVTAIELMPVGTFPGMRNWGYDGVYIFAPHPVYGGPPGLAQLIDAAHAHGLAVFLDVVYNHIGPGFEAVASFGPYFTDRHETLWGPALDYSERGVREWAIQNAELWVRDYHVDGLRLDAVDTIHDESDPHILEELARRIHSLNPNALVVSEVGTGDLRPIEDWGHDAQWADELHHELHVALTGERDGYYSRFGTPAGLARAIAGDARRVVYAQNHDQVGNRALGDRLSPERLRLAASVVLQSPNTPLIFMGEEYGEPNPFQFFADHVDTEAARAAREGRKREFASFAAFAAEVPDPQDEQTFLRSKLSREETPGMRELYAELLRLRRRAR
jgi:maltooligosyltrehalose trehalohydrolase